MRVKINKFLIQVCYSILNENEMERSSVVWSEGEIYSPIRNVQCYTTIWSPSHRDTLLSKDYSQGRQMLQENVPRLYVRGHICCLCFSNFSTTKNYLFKKYRLLGSTQEILAFSLLPLVLWFSVFLTYDGFWNGVYALIKRGLGALASPSARHHLWSRKNPYWIMNLLMP